ncbi:phage integrase N-terminal SAM-like domain-containing protein [Ferrigenium sp. UT5]|uniref:phage integrase N-terminal SAM-like domain-containing protein n=1 Tax=Ferrigenium sp. UT5 TaxID=3242105 RepID=UPI0038B3F9F7
MAQSPELLDQVHDKLRVKHYTLRTEQSYVDWIKRVIYFHDRRSPRDIKRRLPVAHAG